MLLRQDSSLAWSARQLKRRSDLRRAWLYALPYPTMLERTWISKNYTTTQVLIKSSAIWVKTFQDLMNTFGVLIKTPATLVKAC
jgi:hypothetical protein